MAITVVAVAPYPLIPLPLSGTDTTGGVGIECSIDGGPWLTVWGLSYSGTNWTGLGPIVDVGSHSIQVRSFTIPGDVSPSVGFATLPLFSPSYIISGDAPTPPTLAAPTGVTYPTAYEQPPVQSGIPLSASPSGVLTLQGYVASTTGGIRFLGQPWQDEPLSGTEAFGEFDFQDSGPPGTVTTCKLNFFSGISNTVTLARGTAFDWAVAWQACLVETLPNGPVYAITASCNGTVVLQGTGAQVNKGEYSPGWFTSESVIGGSFFLSDALVFASPFGMTLDDLAGAIASATVTLTGTDTADALAAGLDYNLDFAESGSGNGFPLTTLTANAGTGATQLTVASVANFDNMDAIGVILDNGGLFITSVNGTPGGTTIPIAGAMPSQASAGRGVFDYETFPVPSLVFTRVSSFTSATVSGGPWSATIPGLSAGVHVLTVRDHDSPLKQSNSITLDVGGIYLGPIVGAVSGSPAPLVGIDNESPVATAMDWQVDGAGSWIDIGTFSQASNTGSPWSGTGPTEFFGTHSVQVRNHSAPSVVSNIQTFSVSAITLDQVSAISGVAPNITGTDIEDPVASALQYQVDGSDDWLAVESFNPAIAPDGQWSGLGPVEGPGTYTLQVRNTNAPSVESNIVTYTIVAPSAEDCCTPQPSPTLGRYRGACGINFNGMVLFGDAFSGVVGAASFGSFLEYGNAMRALITSPPIHQDRRRVFMPRFELDVESGVGAPECCGVNPVWMLDISKDGGRTFGPLQTFRSMGRIGEYLTRLRWLRLGQGRQWILRLQSTDPVRRVIIGTYYDVYAGMSGSGP